jgi:alpha-amylase
MLTVCCYFQVHQPFRLNQDFTFFEIGSGNCAYEDDAGNREIMRRVADRCYLPTNALMLELIEAFGGRFRIAYSISGVALDQFELYAPEVLESFKGLMATGCVELLSETYYHSLAFLFSPDEFRRQVAAHREKIEELFDYTPTTFRNTELIYNNDLAAEIERQNFKAILTEGATQILGWRTPNYVYQPSPTYRLKLLLKNFQLSDDLAFRFSEDSWDGYPLTADKYAAWIHDIAGAGEVVNLFMDYETFGEHQWAESGIFEFLRAFPGAVLANEACCFMTPCEVAESHQPMAKIDVPHVISWADIERDTTAWLGNDMQGAAVADLYALEQKIIDSGDAALIDTWGRLQTSDHFYYMCTKWYSDGDVHKYFNPYPSPHQAFITFANVLNDIRLRLASGSTDLREKK